MTQHRLLVLGSMDEFVDLVKRARARGYYTLVCDGYADGPAKNVADAAYTIDVRDTQAIAELCRDQGVDGIVSSFSDLLAECLVDIADKAGLACYAKPDRFAFLREKTLMKKMFAELGVGTPKSVCVHPQSIDADLAGTSFPCVAKPSNGYGSRGVYVLDSADEVKKHFDEIASFSGDGCILVEEYNQDAEINMMTWIIDGEPVVLGLADREKSTEVVHAVPHVSRCAYPSRIIDSVIDEARGIARKIAAYVGIGNGPLSVQFFYSKERGIQVCEAAGRLFGYEHELVTLQSGLSIEDVLLDYVYDADSLRKRLSDHDSHGMRQSAGLYFHGFEGVVGDVSSVEKLKGLPGVEQVSLYYEPGECIRHGIGAKPYVVRFYIAADTREELDALTEKLFAEVKVLGENGENMLYRNRIACY